MALVLISTSLAPDEHPELPTASLTVHCEAAVAVSVSMGVVGLTDVHAGILGEDVADHQRVHATAVLLVAEVLAVGQDLFVAHPDHLHGLGTCVGGKGESVILRSEPSLPLLS